MFYSPLLPQYHAPTDMIRKSFFALALLACVADAHAQDTAVPVTAIRAGRLVDVDAARVLTNQIILIRNGKIDSVGDQIGRAHV